MKETRLIMGMPVTIALRDPQASLADIEKIFRYFEYVDQKYSPFKPDSEVSLINQSPGFVPSAEMKEIIRLCEDTKIISHGYFDAFHFGKFDPSGIVKGWAIKNAAGLLASSGFQEYYIEAGGDIQVAGSWAVGIRNPFDSKTIVKSINLKNMGIATSGNYERGNHIYDPFGKISPGSEVVSLTIIAPDVYEADRFATAAFAMGAHGIEFISSFPHLAAYQIGASGKATFTSNFEKYVVQN